MSERQIIKAFLVHLGMNMWTDRRTLGKIAEPEKIDYYRDDLFSSHLQVDDVEWNFLLSELGRRGCNMIVLDLGDAIVYKSHPEIAVDGAWSRERLKNELTRCRDFGLEVIPKLNFSTAHDAWMGEISRMVSTKPYYAFCKDLIAEAMELFDGPRFLHIGMDEETAWNQEEYDYTVIRGPELWSHDLRFYADEVKKNGGDAWMWSDYLWDKSEEAYAKAVPTEIVQSNWFYADVCDKSALPDHYVRKLECFDILDRLGYRQIACGSSWAHIENYPNLVKYGRETLEQSTRFLGYMMAPWYSTEEHNRKRHEQALELFSTAHE